MGLALWEVLTCGGNGEVTAAEHGLVLLDERHPVPWFVHQHGGDCVSGVVDQDGRLNVHRVGHGFIIITCHNWGQAQLVYLCTSKLKVLFFYCKIFLNFCMRFGMITRLFWRGLTCFVIRHLL